MIIHLIRHGQVDGPPALYGHTDVPLHPVGYQALERATAQLGTPTKIISSPLQRCRQFAQDKATTLNIPLEVLPKLTEMHFGDWDGVPFDEHSPLWPDMLDFWASPAEHPAPNGESLTQMQQRVSQAWQQLIAGAEEHLWVVCHGGVIRLLIAQLLQLDWRNPQLYSTLSVGYASTTTVYYDVCQGISRVQLQSVAVPAPPPRF